MSLADLSRTTEISIRSLTAWENGHSEPTHASTEKLAAALQMPVVFFFSRSLDILEKDAVSFRKLSKTSASKRDSALAAGRLAICIGDWIAERFNLPAPAVPTLDQHQGDPETAAIAVRARWGLGAYPVQHMLDLVEAHGVRVFSLATDCRDVDAFSCWWDGTPYIFMNTSKSAERSRFDVAHELGHLVLHSEAGVPHGPEAEKAANRFAAAFLMPSEAVIAQGLHNASVESILRTKMKWGVAAMALTHRLRELGLLTEWGYKHTCVSLSRLGYRSGEPQGLPREASQLLSKVFQELRTQGHGATQIADEIGLDVEELNRHVFGLVMTTVKGGRAKTTVAERSHLSVVRSDADHGAG